MNTDTKTPIADAASERYESNCSEPNGWDLAEKFEIALRRIATFDRDVTGGPEMAAIAREALGES
jgi:hypothetical protein